MKIRSITTSKYENKKLFENDIINVGESSSYMSGSDNKTIININTNKRYQTFYGFGGAFTEAGSTTLDKLPKELRQQAIDAYFHPEKGINYSFCRTHINSCDFSIGNYSYAEDPNDIALKSFSIERDKKSLIPFIKNALATKRGDLVIFASPWSPPAWMKTNGRMNTGGSLEKKYYKAWAQYFVKYLAAYKAEGINIWGITIQNEPQAVTPWENCIYSPEEERDFIKILGNTFQNEGFDEVKIIAWDHNKDKLKERADVILSDREACDFVWGIGFHWYNHNDENVNLDNSSLDYTHEKYGKNLVFTEGCTVLRKGQSLIGKWWTGERYGANIINDLNHWTVAWCDWNMFLDENGGPNHAMNFCDAPVIADTKNDLIHYNSPYYYIAHFSKFILPGAVRIDTEISCNNLHTTAFINNDGSIIIVVMNTSEEDVSFEIRLKDKFIPCTGMKRSIQSFIVTD